MAIRPQLLRQIATSELEKILPNQEDDARTELVTSVVRQWSTYGGRAGVFTAAVHYWFVVEEHGNSVRVGREVCPGTLSQHLATWGMAEGDLPRIAWELSVAQSATLINADGLTVRVRVDPRDHTFRFEEVSDEEWEE